jgi:hypothetical protein
MRPTLLCWYLAAACAAAVPVAAQELSRPITPAEVECTELQLQRLLGRVREQLPDRSTLTNLFLAPGPGGGSYQGLLVVSQTTAPARPERQLAFHLDPVRSLLLNPARPPLGQVALTREEPASNLTAAAAELAGVAVFPGSGTPPEIGSPLDLVIDNRSGAAGKATSTKPGRGLEQDDLLTACSDRLTPFDRRIFELLQRMIKVETMIFLGSPHFVSSQITVFRGADPYVYRLNAYGGAGSNRKVAVEIRIEPTVDGRLGTAVLHLRPPCFGPFPNFDPRPGCTDKVASRPVSTRILLARPVFGGAGTWDRTAAGVGQIYHQVPGADPWITDSTADLAALLAGTAWNGGV